MELLNASVLAAEETTAKTVAKARNWWAPA